MNISNIWSDRWQVCFLGLMLIGMVLVFTTFDDYSITIDEPPHHRYGEEILKWYASGFEDRTFFSRVSTLYYGGFFDSLVYVATRVLTFEPYDTRHLCNAVVGMLGLVVVYFFGRFVGGTRVGFVAALFLVLTPRYYGHVFNNPKDIPFAVFYLASLYALAKTLYRFPDVSWKDLIWLAISIGLALGVRIGGLVLFVYVALFWAMRYAQVGGKGGFGLWRIGVVKFLLVLGIAWFVMLIFWPLAQLNPIGVPFEALGHFSNLTLYNTVLFEGQWLRSTEVPWYYAPKWFLLAMPEFVFLGLICGAVVLLVGRVRVFKSSVDSLLWFLIGLGAFFPVIYVVIINAPLHDGLRHLLFAVLPLTLLSAGGLVTAYDACSRVALKRSLVVGTTCLLTLTLWDMVRLHPNQYVYFNRLFAGGVRGASGQYAMDYWENSYKEGVRWLDRNAQHLPDRRLRVHAPSWNVRLLLDSEYYDFIEVPQDIDFYVSTTRDDKHKMVPGEVLHTVDRDGVPLLYIIRPDTAYNNAPLFAQAPIRDFNLAWRAGGAQDFETALGAFQRLLPLYPRHPMIHNNIGGCYLELGQYSEAEQAFRQALELDPDYTKARMRLGLTLFHLQKTDEAITLLREAVQQTPHDVEALQSFGFVLSQQGFLEESVEMFQRVLALNPDNVGIVGALAILLYQTKRYNEAIPVLRQAMKFMPQDVRFPLVLGRIYDQLGQPNKAVEAYEHVLALDPGHSEARSRLTELLSDN